MTISLHALKTKKINKKHQHYNNPKTATKGAARILLLSLPRMTYPAKFGGLQYGRGSAGE
jgi:hypothetical protein